MDHSKEVLCNPKILVLEELVTHICNISSKIFNTEAFVIISGEKFVSINSCNLILKLI